MIYIIRYTVITLNCILHLFDRIKDVELSIGMSNGGKIYIEFEFESLNHYVRSFLESFMLISFFHVFVSKSRYMGARKNA